MSVYITETQAWEKIVRWFGDPILFSRETEYGLCYAVAEVYHSGFISRRTAITMAKKLNEYVKLKADSSPDMITTFLWPVRGKVQISYRIAFPGTTPEQTLRLRAALARRFAQESKEQV